MMTAEEARRLTNESADKTLKEIEGQIRDAAKNSNTSVTVNFPENLLGIVKKKLSEAGYEITMCMNYQVEMVTMAKINISWDEAVE